MNSMTLQKVSRTAAPLTDAEIQSSLDYYSKLEEALSPCPPEYRLTLLDVRRNIDRLSEMKNARQAGKDWVARQKRPAYPTSETLPTVSVRV